MVQTFTEIPLCTHETRQGAFSCFCTEAAAAIQALTCTNRIDSGCYCHIFSDNGTDPGPCALDWQCMGATEYGYSAKKHPWQRVSESRSIDSGSLCYGAKNSLGFQIMQLSCQKTRDCKPDSLHCSVPFDAKGLSVDDYYPSATQSYFR